MQADPGPGHLATLLAIARLRCEDGRTGLAGHERREEPAVGKASVSRGVPSRGTHEAAGRVLGGEDPSEILPHAGYPFMEPMTMY